MTLDIETRIERDIERAVAASRSSDINLWIAAFYAARVVGRYEEYATLELAKRAGRKVSTVQSWANAYRMYQKLKLTGNCQLARKLRKTLTVSHFVTMWEEQNKHEIPTPAAENYLAQMVAYKADEQPHSVATLKQEIQSHYDMLGERPVITWVSQRDHVRNSVIRWLDYKDVPADVYGLIEQLLRRLE